MEIDEDLEQQLSILLKIEDITIRFQFSFVKYGPFLENYP